MVSCTVVLLLLSLSSIANGFTLLPLDMGLDGDGLPFMTRERTEFDDCHLRYARYGRTEVNVQDPTVPYNETRELQHVVAIGWTRRPGTIEWPCMGVLIWENLVLSTAHCSIDDAGTAPDVVRMGGGDYFPDSSIPEREQRRLQQRAIVAITRHPDYRAGENDIALLKLDKPISVNPTAGPACMWLYDAVPFPLLETVGWKRQTPRRTGRVSKIVSTEEFEQAPNGGCGAGAAAATSQQFCVARANPDSSQCLDSRGGVLQMRLLHNYRTTPFVLGLQVADDASCTTPTRAYTKLASFRDWILAEVQKLSSTVNAGALHPAACALHYVHFRPRVEDLLQEREGEMPWLGAQVSAVEDSTLKYIVQIVWPPNVQGGARNDCVGTFVDQQTVLTLAECVGGTTPGGVKPTSVRTKHQYRSMSYNIASIVVHPEYGPATPSANLAVIKLARRAEVIPACIWLAQPDVAPDRVDLAGVGRNQLHTYSDRTDGDISEPAATFILPAVERRPWAECSARVNRSLAGLSGDDSLCFEEEHWMVPEACQTLRGGPVQRYVGRDGAFYKYVFGLNLFGGTCGYGMPAVAIALAPHATWLRSVMMTQRKPAVTSQPVLFINPDLRPSDECRNGDGSDGVCVPHERCLVATELLSGVGAVTFCTNGSIICCPWGDITRGASANPGREQLDGCEDRYQAIRKQRWIGWNNNETQYDNMASLAEIGWPLNGGKLSFPCSGFLITPQTIVTTARCAETYSWKPTVARIGALGASDATNYLVQPIRRVTVHDDYDESSGLHNLALITLATAITPSAHVFPACLWSNRTHAPLRPSAIHLQEYEPNVVFVEVFPLYDRDCEERLNTTLADGQLCLLRGSPETKYISVVKCLQTGANIVWDKRDGPPEVEVPQYLVGIFSHGGCASNEDILIATRISHYYDWIASRLK
ncbi:uncharacterized protein LOC128269509 [Anopheles cruzii]|uniref:uncharacterized protein LOC128269509 n=1 Tax=Anopheles cruzii TaxID=68878 RepID=UPI0022EC2DF4|nr:uncharacterized protein LOC128269509 [Anopheles cruzii]